MANGFPKPSQQPAFPTLARSASTSASPSGPSLGNAESSLPVPAEPRATKPRNTLLRSWAPWCGLAAVGVAALLFSNRPLPAARTSTTPVERVAPAQPAPLIAPTAARKRAPDAPSAAAPDAEPAPFSYTDPPRVPEAYTGDPEGQALWEKTVEEDQQTLQPDDLIEEPPRPGLDLTKIPAYQAEHIDADGNLN